MTNLINASILISLCLFNFTKPSDEIVMMNPLSLYELSFESIDGQSISLADFKGKKLLLVNTASRCGYTRQYKDLQKLHESYSNELIVIGFPCNDFGSQEKGTNEEILEFCQKNYGVDFLLSEKINIKGDQCHPVFKWLKSKSLNGVSDNKVSWNFNKFLINEKGELVSAFPSNVSPFDEKIIQQLN